MAIKNITGMRSGRLVAIRPMGYMVESNGDRRAVWECKCDCGNYTKATCQEITMQRKKSCGCSRRKQEIIVTEEKAPKDIKVIKEQTEDFGEITVVVIDGECYFLFREINNVMRLERHNPHCTDSGYTNDAFRDVLKLHGWRIEDVPEIGEQLLINFTGVSVCYTKAKTNLYYWAGDEGLSTEKEEEMKKQILYFFQDIAKLDSKYTNRDVKQEKNLPIIKALWDITGEEIFV